jgi:hypothetical protein
LQLLVQGMVDEAQPKVFQLPYVDDESFKVFDQVRTCTTSLVG